MGDTHGSCLTIQGRVDFYSQSFWGAQKCWGNFMTVALLGESKDSDKVQHCQPSGTLLASAANILGW